MRISIAFAFFLIGLVLFANQASAQSSLFSGSSGTTTTTTTTTTSDDSDNSNLDTITGSTLSPDARTTTHEIHLLEIYDTRGVRSNFADQFYSTSSGASYIAPSAILLGAIAMVI